MRCGRLPRKHPQHLESQQIKMLFEEEDEGEEEEVAQAQAAQAAQAEAQAELTQGVHALVKANH